MQEEEIIYEASGVIEEINPEVVEVDIFEAFQAPTASDEFNHALLTNREIHDAHPITAITGLREELDSIEALQTVYSDKKGNADYYEWADGHALGENGVGYFVSLNADARTISICTGDDIFGVVVDNAAFVGGQDDIARDEHYGLVATSGAVHVRCELDVAEGDYVVSNAYGVATTASSGRGYKIVALHDIGGVPHATINLNISADQIDLMGAELQDLDSRMDDAETNIVSAINVANEAHKRSLEAATSSSVSEEVVKEALESILNSEKKIEEFEQTVGSTSVTAAQARAIAESAVTTATSIKNEAVDEAKKALDETSELRDDFKSMEEGITEIDDRVTIVTNRVAGKYTTVASWDKTGKDTDTVYYAEDTKLYWYYDNNDWKSTADAYTAGLPMAVAGIQVKVDNHSSSINSLSSWQGETNIAMARIEQKADANGAYIQSTVSNMNKYSVGPHSQAYGFTRKQAASVLEEGMIYVPTEDEITEEYVGEGDLPTYSREFSQGYLYRWGEVSDGYGWITIDKNYSENKLNTSAPAVYFSTTLAPSVSDSVDFGYWYTNGDTLTGTASAYEPYTLYKWDLPYKYQDKTDDGTIVDVEEYRWVAVATLAGNSQSRAVSQIRQDANSIEVSVTDLNKNYAGIRGELTGTQSTVQQLSKWANNGATVKTEANEDGSAVTITAYSENETTGEITERASLVLNVVKDSDGNPTSALSIDADNINFNAQDVDFSVANSVNFGTHKFNVYADEILFQGEDGSKMTFDASNIDFTGDNFSIDADRIIGIETPEFSLKGQTINIEADDVLGIQSPHFSVDTAGNMTATSGYIANWEISQNTLKSGKVGLSSEGVTDSSIRIYAGDTTASSAPFRVTDGGKLFASNADIEGKVVADDGEIGGWIIDDTALYSSDDNASCGLSAFSGELDATDGLIFEFDSDSKTYSVTGVSSETIRSVHIPAVYQGYPVTSIGNYAFYGCSSLTSVTISNGLTSIYNYAFYDCTSLTSIIIPDSVTKIEWSIFYNCTSLTSAIIGSGSTYINPYMFYGCSNLAKIEIPDSITGIGDYAFDGCSNLAVIYYTGTSTQWGNITIDSNNSCLSSATISYGRRLNLNSYFYGLDSLVNDGGASPIRFFAGYDKKDNDSPIPHIATTKPKFAVLEDGSLYASAANIGGEISTDTVIGGNLKLKGDKIWLETFQDGEALRICDSNRDSYVYVGQRKLSFSAPVKHTDGIDRVSTLTMGESGLGHDVNFSSFDGYLAGTWTTENELSDERAKNTIETMPESYDVLFDNLQPKRYKYNHGTSGRFHTGYIAQEVVEAIETAGLTTQDFAGVMLNKPNTEEERWYLRRDEFVSLNTWQIQKLKTRTTELETKVAELEELVKRLEEKLNTQQND